MFELSHRLIGIYKTSNVTKSTSPTSLEPCIQLTTLDRYLHRQPRLACCSNNRCPLIYSSSLIYVGLAYCSLNMYIMPRSIAILPQNVRDRPKQPAYRSGRDHREFFPARWIRRSQSCSLQVEGGHRWRAKGV